MRVCEEIGQHHSLHSPLSPPTYEKPTEPLLLCLLVLVKPESCKPGSLSLARKLALEPPPSSEARAVRQDISKAPTPSALACCSESRCSESQILCARLTREGKMDLSALLHSLIPSWSSAGILLSYFVYLALAGAILPGKNVAGAVLSDATRLHYRCNGLASLFILMALLGIGISTRLISPTIIADKGAQLFSVTFIFSVIVTLLLYVIGRKSCDKSSSLRARATGNFIHDWWFGVQLNPHFMGIDLKFFFVRAGMMGWLFINLSLFSKSLQAGNTNLSVILYQLFCALYVIDYFFHEEFMTSTWDVIAENLGFMLVFGDLVFIPFTFSIQGWWLLGNNVELSKVAALINCLIFLIGYQIFRGANKQKHVFKKDPKAPIWGKPPKVIGGKLLASGYWGISRHCNYLGDLLLALSFSLPCGTSSVIPYFYPIYLLILLIWRERRDDSRCSGKYKEIWAEYCKHVPWRILPYVY